MSAGAPSLYVYFNTGAAPEPDVRAALRALQQACRNGALPAPRIERRPATATRRTWMLVWTDDPRIPQIEAHCARWFDDSGLAALSPEGWHVERFEAVEPDQA